MKTLAVALVMLASTAAAQTAQDGGPPSQHCREYAKFTVVVHDAGSVASPIAIGDIPVEIMTFWERQDSLAAGRARLEVIAREGAWGTGLVNGVRHSGYYREFFPPSRIIRTRIEYDCPH